jgi:putative transcriptional regulator
MIAPLQAPCLLVAMPGMMDSTFTQSVILLAEHNRAGAIGFILNRPSTVSLKAMISTQDREIPEAIPAWYGGPVDTTTAIILHDHTPSDLDTIITPGIYLSTAPKTLDQLIVEGAQRLKTMRMDSSTSIANPETIMSHTVDFSQAQQSHRGHQTADEALLRLHSFRFLVGYAGWGAQQLDDELNSGSWALCPIDRKLVFDTPWSELWNICIDKLGFQKNTKPVLSQQPSAPGYLN